MVRAFTAEPLPPGAVDDLLDLARRAPSAGHTQGWAFVALEGPEETAGYWDVTLPARAPGVVPLARAGRRPRARGGPGPPGGLGGALRRGRQGRHGPGGRGPRRGRCRTGGSTAAWRWSTCCSARPPRASAPASSGCSTTRPPCWPRSGVPDGWRAVGTIALGHPAPDSARPLRHPGPAAAGATEVAPPRRLVASPMPRRQRGPPRTLTSTDQIGSGSWRQRRTTGSCSPAGPRAWCRRRTSPTTCSPCPSPATARCCCAPSGWASTPRCGPGCPRPRATSSPSRSVTWSAAAGSVGCCARGATGCPRARWSPPSPAGRSTPSSATTPCSRRRWPTAPTRWPRSACSAPTASPPTSA